MAVPVAGLLISVLSQVAGPLMAIPAPGYPIAAGVSFSQPPEVTITVADDKQRVRGGQMIRYQVVVRNSGAMDAPVLVRLTLPPGAVSGLHAENAAVVANAVAWRASVAAGQTVTYSLAGRVERDSKERDLTVTACLHSATASPALACATDRNVIADAAPARPERKARWAWLGAVLFGGLAVVGALWLHRKVNPPLLAPATAESGVQPGGAPSA